RRHTRFSRDWSSDVCSSDLAIGFFQQRVEALVDSDQRIRIDGFKSRDVLVVATVVVRRKNILLPLLILQCAIACGLERRGRRNQWAVFVYDLALLDGIGCADKFA